MENDPHRVPRGICAYYSDDCLGRDINNFILLQLSQRHAVSIVHEDIQIYEL